MKLTSERRPQALAFGLVLASLLGALGWFWWSATQRTDIAFLPHRPGAEWIAFPCPPEIMNQSRIEMQTVFKRSFQMDQVPATSVLRVAALHTYSLSINGASVAEPTARGKNWKQPDTFELTGRLRPGENQLEVTVSNTNGPAALWLRLQAGALTLASDTSWDASYAGSAWKRARLGATPRVALKGNPTYGGETPWSSLKTSWRLFLLFAALGALSSCGLALMSRTPTGVGWPAKRLLLENLPFIAVAAVWIALFVNNLRASAPLGGYDVEGHVAYVQYIQVRHSLPLASEGWEMFQPPLYYLLCAGLLNFFSLSVLDPDGATVLRILGLGIGIAHFALVSACLRLLFPNNAPPLHASRSTLLAPSTFGMLLAAFLAPVLFLAHYVTNEAMAAMLVTASVYLTLRTLKQEPTSWKLEVVLGLSLGGALLTKATAVLLLPLVSVTLIWHALRPKKTGAVGYRSHRFWGIALVFGICGLVSGWHYVRVWRHYGNPLLGVWDPRTGFFWWQDEGYRTSAFYLHLGEGLIHPWYSSMRSFIDGIYSTLWGDGLFSGASELRYRPPWNYDLMMVGYWLALLPTLAILAGAVIAVIRFIRQPSPEWFLLLGLGFLVCMAVIHLSLTIPYYCSVKAFYGLSFLAPLCTCATVAWQALIRHAAISKSPTAPRWPISRRTTAYGAGIFFGGLFCLWAINSYGSFWIRSSSMPALLSQVWHYLEQGHYAEAAAALKTRLELRSNSARDAGSEKAERADIHCVLASVFLVSGNYADAQQEAEAALRDNRDNGDARLTLEQALTHQKHADEAMAHARQATELLPGCCTPYIDLAWLLLKKADYKEAIQVAREGLTIAPPNPQLHLVLGCSLLATGEHAAALPQLQLAFNLKTNWPAAHELLGSVLQQSGHYDVAVEAYAQALRSNPDDGECQAALGSLLLMQGRLDEAGAHLSEAVRLQPANARARYRLAGTLQAQHKTSEAITQYLKTLRLEPGFPAALNDLAWILVAERRAEFRNGDEAVRLAEEACQLTEYKEPIFVGTLAAAYAEAGRFPKAVATAERARDLAIAAGLKEVADRNSQLLELYRAGKPFHESPQEVKR